MGLSLPLDVAADRVGEFNRRLLTRQQRIDSVGELVGGFFARISRVVVHSPGVTQSPRPRRVLVESIEVRRAQGTVRGGGRLGLIAQVGEGKVLFLCPLHHVVE